MSALTGRRVVVTRPRSRARELCAALADRGAEVVQFPVIETHTLAGGTLDVALGELGRYDWIAFASAAAVDAFVERCVAVGARLPAARIVAVGPATAAALREAGVAVHAVPATHRGTGLAAAMRPLAGQRILLPASAIAREETAAALAAAGALVDVVTAYETRAVAPAPEAMAELARGADAVTFTSPSTVAAFRDVGGAAAAALLHSAVLACIGPTTGAAVRALGLTAHVETEVHLAPALADALDRYFAAAHTPQETVR